jgi:hypothetical protein
MQAPYGRFFYVAATSTKIQQNFVFGNKKPGIAPGGDGHEKTIRERTGKRRTCFLDSNKFTLFFASFNITLLAVFLGCSKLTQRLLNGLREKFLFLLRAKAKDQIEAGLSFYLPLS